jgi:hypothetical protein
MEVREEAELLLRHGRDRASWTPQVGTIERERRLWLAIQECPLAFPSKISEKKAKHPSTAAIYH